MLGVIRIVGSVFAGVLCLRRVDLKVIIAYSSVRHMGLVFMAFSRLTFVGFAGGILVIIAHGVCSAGIFYFVGEIYRASHSRRIFLNGFWGESAPRVAGLWGLLCVLNIAGP